MLWWLLPGEGWDAVAINCKKGASTKCQVYGLRGVC